MLKRQISRYLFTAFFTVYFKFLLLSFKPSLACLSFVHPTHLLSIYYMIVTILNPEDTVMNKVNRFSFKRSETEVKIIPVLTEWIK